MSTSIDTAPSPKSPNTSEVALAASSSKVTVSEASDVQSVQIASPGTPAVRSSTRIDPVADTSRKSPVSSARR